MEELSAKLEDTSWRKEKRCIEQWYCFANMPLHRCYICLISFIRRKSSSIIFKTHKDAIFRKYYIQRNSSYTYAPNNYSFSNLEYYGLILANHPQTSSKILAELTQHIVKEVRLLVARHPNITQNSLYNLISDRNPEVREAALANPKLDATFKQEFISVENNNLSLAKLRKLANSKYKIIREKVALHPNVDRDILIRLSNDKFNVRIAVAKNPQTPTDILLKYLMLRKSYHIRMDMKLLELYTDYIISSFGQVTATGLSRALEGIVSHDKITRFLSKEDWSSKELWKLVKSGVREHEKEDGVLIVDDTIEQKLHTTESELICWHHDHLENCSVKGINLINYVYNVDEISIPVSFDVVKKPIKLCSLKTKKEKRQATVTKNELVRNQLKICQKNQLQYKYVLSDSWFSSKENMDFIHEDLNKHFVMALKSNRTIALSQEDKKQGNFIRVDSISWLEQRSVRGWLKGLDFPVLIHRQVFKNKDGSTGILYLACSELDCKPSEIEAIYKKRWNVEVFHKTLKSNTGLAKSPTKCIRTQTNHTG